MNAHSPRKILWVAHSGAQGGAELCLDTVLRSLDRNRFEPTVVFGGEGPMVDSARALGLDVQVQHWSWWLCFEPCRWYFKNLLLGVPLRVWTLVRRIRREKIDLVVTNTAVVFEGALAALVAGVPHVWHIDEVLTSDHVHPALLPLGLVVRLLGLLARRVIFPSVASSRICRGRIPEEKMRIVPNAVRFSAAEAIPDRKSARERFQIAEDSCAVAWIGQFIPRKNPEMLLHAIARMQRASKAVFLLAGGGPLQERILEQIHELHLESVCRVLPFQEDVRPLLVAADVLALTSQEESFGLVLVEAAVFGKPAVATCAEGPREIIDDGRTGFLVGLDDEAALAERLDRLVADVSLRQSLGLAAAARTAERFSAQHVTRRVEGVLDEVLGECRR